MRPESFLRSCALTAAYGFVLLAVFNCLTIYSWLHPALWAFGLLALFVIEAVLFYLRVERRAETMPVAAALGAAVMAWFSFEFVAVALTVNLLIRLFPPGWIARAGSVLLAAALLVLMGWADINPWSDYPGTKLSLILFRSTCAICAFLVLVHGWLLRRR